MKIVGIGLSKTGTTSLKKALQILGYDSIGWSERAAQLYSNKKLDILEYKYMNKFNAFTSEPWAQMYRLFDHLHDCKFICTYRDKFAWFESIKNHVVSRGTQKNLGLVYPFSDPEKEKEKMLKYYTNWYANIDEYFVNKNNINNIIYLQDFSWPQICKFLDKEIPDVPFPYLNKGIEHNQNYKTGEK